MEETKKPTNEGERQAPLALHQPIAALPNIKSHIAKTIRAEKNLLTIGDLLYYFPYRYEERNFHLLNQAPTGEEILCKGTITNLRFQGKARRKVLTATLHDGSGALQLLWFHHVDYLYRKVPRHTALLLAGRITLQNGKRTMVHPQIKPLPSEQKPTSVTLPIYSSTEKMHKVGLDSAGMRKFIDRVLRQVQSAIVENLPTWLLDRYRLKPRDQALQQIHNPTTISELQASQQRIKFEETFFMRLGFSRKKSPATPFTKTELLTKCYHELPFDLTDAQKKAAREIVGDLKRATRMNRLLQGDVGSGKTVVALLAMLLVVGSGGKAALPVPTELVARQHYQRIVLLTKKFGVRVALLTGAIQGKRRKEVMEQVEGGEVDILVGTHALLHLDNARLPALGLVVIDEQHRFGVAQRAILPGQQEPKPHLLIMSATPIPRTLATALYGGLSTSIIDELPKRRQPTITQWVPHDRRPQIYHLIRKVAERGGQVFVVYPRIHASNKQELKDLMNGYQHLSEVFPRYPIGILHGKMKSEEKNDTIAKFISKQYTILVTTTIIEVGVDIPNANLIVIEHAERYGFTQLHQCRGRVGRRTKGGYCILATGPTLKKAAKERIEHFLTLADGFAIAEADLQLRGAGDLGGLAQSGIPPLKMVDLQKDSLLIAHASHSVDLLLERDPLLEQPCHQGVRKFLEEGGKWWEVS